MAEMPFGAAGAELDRFPSDEDSDEERADPGGAAGGSGGRGGDRVGDLHVLESSAPHSMNSTFGSTGLSFGRSGALPGADRSLGLSMTGAGFDSTGGSFGDTSSSLARRRGRGPQLNVSTGGGMAAPGILEPARDDDGGLEILGRGDDGGLEILGRGDAGADDDDGGLEMGPGRGAGGPAFRGDASELLDDTMGSTGAGRRGRKGPTLGGTGLSVSGGGLGLSMSGSLSRKRGVKLSLGETGPGAAPGMLKPDEAAGGAEPLWSTGDSPKALDLMAGAGGLEGNGTMRIGGVFEVKEGGMRVSDPASAAALAVLAAIEGAEDGAGGGSTPSGSLDAARRALQDGSAPLLMNAALAKALARAAEGGGAAEADDPWGPRSIRDELITIDALGSGASGSVTRALHIPSLQLVAVKSVRVYEARNREQMAAELKLLYANIAKLPSGPAGTPSGAAAAASGAPELVIDGSFAASDGETCPNIVRLFDAYSAKDKGSVHIVMELMAGGSLQDLVDAGGTQDEAELATIAADVFRGLSFLHSQRQLHRDIKPANILRASGGGQCKLADFGIAKQLQGTAEMAQTWVGTLQYMSPERIDQDGDGYAFPADVWSAGISILAVAAGRFPYRGSQDYFAMLGAVKDEAPPLDCLDEHGRAGRPLSPAFRDFITRCLTKDPRRRITAAEAMGHPFVRSAWTAPAPAAPGSAPAVPPWAGRYDLSAEKRSAVARSLSKLSYRLFSKHFPTYARFHVRGADALAVRQRRMAHRLDDSTFNRDKAERILISAGATGDFSRLNQDVRTMTWLAGVAHASALKRAGMSGTRPGLRRAASLRHAGALHGVAAAADPRLAASGGVGARFDHHASDPLTKRGQRLLVRSLAGKARPEELGEEGVRAMTQALRAGAARAMRAWEDDDEDDDEAAAAAALEAAEADDVAPSFGLAEYGVGPEDDSSVITRKVPRRALEVEKEDVEPLSEQLGLLPASVQRRFNKTLERYYDKKLLQGAVTPAADRPAAAGTLREAAAAALTPKPAAASSGRPPSKRAPKPAKAVPLPGRRPPSAEHRLRVAGKDTPIAVYGRAGASRGAPDAAVVNLRGVRTEIPTVRSRSGGRG